MRSISFEDKPFAYIQNYDVADWPEDHYYTKHLKLSGVPKHVIDPKAHNHRAIRTYQKAGFSIEKLVHSDDGVVCVMVL